MLPIARMHHRAGKSRPMNPSISIAPHRNGANRSRTRPGPGSVRARAARGGRTGCGNPTAPGRARAARRPGSLRSRRSCCRGAAPAARRRAAANPRARRIAPPAAPPAAARCRPPIVRCAPHWRCAARNSSRWAGSRHRNRRPLDAAERNRHHPTASAGRRYNAAPGALPAVHGCPRSNSAVRPAAAFAAPRRRRPCGRCRGD